MVNFSSSPFNCRAFEAVLGRNLMADRIIQRLYAVEDALIRI